MRGTDLEHIARRLASGALSFTALEDGTGVVVDVDALRVLSLNTTGMFIVERLRDGVTDREALVRAVVARFEVDAEQAAADLDGFAAALQRALEPPSGATAEG